MRWKNLSLAVVAAALLSCSVKEDRSGCACLLVLDMSPCANAPDNIRIDLRTSDGRIQQDFIPGKDRPYYEYPVAKGTCSLTAFLCPRDLSSGTDRIVIDPGENCPELYASRSEFEVTGETAEQLVVLHKQFAAITLDMDEYLPVGSSCDITVKGGVNGLSLENLKPLEGPFRYEVPQEGRENPAFRVPRQTETSAGKLTVEIRLQGGTPHVFELGRYLSEAGYDWGREDLEDVVVKLKESEIVIQISSSDWIIHTADIVVI